MNKFKFYNLNFYQSDYKVTKLELQAMKLL